MSNIFRRIYSGQLITSLIVLFIMSICFIFGIKASIYHWKMDKTTDLENVLLPVISKAYRFGGRLDSTVLEDSILPYLTDSLYAYVFDENKTPVLLLNRGERITLAQAETQIGSMQSFLTLNPPKEIKNDKQIIGYLSVDSIDFLAYKANKSFIATMWKTIAAGIIAAVVITLSVSFFISSFFSKQTNHLIAEISDLTTGNRSVRFVKSDMDEFNRITDSVEILQSRLEHEESLRQQWMEDISHDLRTPITAVKAQLEAMSAGALDTGKKRLDSLFGSMNHIEKLVNNLQDLTRFESPRMKIQSSKIDPTLFVEDLKERFEFLAEQKNISYDCRIDSVAPFFADKNLLLRCTSNIIQNALQYTNPGGKICVRFRGANQSVELEVANTGHLSERDLEHMFDRMYRGDSSRSGGGYGLGLSIAKAIMTLHKGTITAENRNDQVCLTMRFPLQENKS
ncbi:MAG TPA: sensor histidine kinase [Treponema sp.]|nr:sensor histidine kinase [Treponema sp.]